MEAIVVHEYIISWPGKILPSSFMAKRLFLLIFLVEEITGISLFCVIRETGCDIWAIYHHFRYGSSKDTS